MKTIVRNISVGLIIVSYFLPWIDVQIKELNGFQLMMVIFGLGSEMDEGVLTFIGFVVLVMFISAIGSLFKSYPIPLILLLIISTVLMAVFFLVNEISYVKESGVYVTLLGVIGCYVSLFLSDTLPHTATTTNTVHQHATQQVAATRDKEQTAQPAFTRYCSHCGNGVKEVHKFCKDCGQST